MNRSTILTFLTMGLLVLMAAPQAQAQGRVMSKHSIKKNKPHRRTNHASIAIEKDRKFKEAKRKRDKAMFSINTLLDKAQKNTSNKYRVILEGGGATEAYRRDRAEKCRVMFKTRTTHQRHYSLVLPNVKTIRPSNTQTTKNLRVTCSKLHCYATWRSRHRHGLRTKPKLIELPYPSNPAKLMVNLIGVRSKCQEYMKYQRQMDALK